MLRALQNRLYASVPFTCVHPLTQTIYRDLQIVSTRLYERNGKGIETMGTRE